MLILNIVKISTTLMYICNMYVHSVCVYVYVCMYVCMYVCVYVLQTDISTRILTLILVTSGLSHLIFRSIYPSSLLEIIISTFSSKLKINQCIVVVVKLYGIRLSFAMINQTHLHLHHKSFLMVIVTTCDVHTLLNVYLLRCMCVLKMACFLTTDCDFGSFTKYEFRFLHT